MTVEIYGAAWCSYCTKATELCNTHNIRYLNYDVDNFYNMQELHDRLEGKLPRTVPQIFIDDIHIGGYNELKEALDGTSEED